MAPMLRQQRRTEAITAFPRFTAGKSLIGYFKSVDRWLNLHGKGDDSLLLSLARTAISQAVIEVGDSHAGRAISQFLEATPEISWPQLLEWVKATMPSPIQKSPVDQLSAWQAKCAAHLTQPNSTHSLQAAQKLAKDLREVLFDGDLLYNTAV